MKEYMSNLLSIVKHASKQTLNRAGSFGKQMHSAYLKQVKSLMPKARIGDYIEKHCRVYNDDSPDDPTLTPSGKHISYPVKNLKMFKKYFKIVPRSEIGIIVNKSNKKGEN